MPAGVITIPVVPGMESFGGMLKSGLGAALATAGVAASFGAVIKLGNDFTNTLNTLQAVSGASAAQMKVVGDRAKELGNDLSIPNTSASNAAEAMTELAKGGFTVEQSMQAAKGTLQLAAAAQIDAATAAGIQSKALQAFGLDATYAGKAADVLANAANASNLEITDVALGLQAGGAVANQFGLTLEDSSAALGVFANAGIRGSDAGTLLKSSLLALTDQGNPAQGAIKQLGLTVYDTQGKFVGYSSLLHQLEEASKSMTEEQYQAATATLFGSDAMRVAGLATEGAAGKFDAMVVAVNKQGTAAEVAAAKTQGLPGAIQQVQNAAENAALELYDLIDGPLEKLATSAASGITAATTGISNAIKSVGDSGVQSSPLIAGFVDGLSGLKDAGGKVIEVVKPMAVGLIDIVKNLDKSGGVIETTSQVFHGFVAVIGGALTVLKPVAEAVGDIATFFSELPGPVQSAAFALVAIRIGATLLAPAFTAAGASLGAMTARVGASVAGFQILAGTIGTTRAAMSTMASGASGLVSALGGPLVIGLTAATIALTSWMQSNAEADRSLKQYDESAKKVGAAQRDMTKAFAESKGALNDTVLGTIATQVDGLREKLQALADGPAKGIAQPILDQFDALKLSSKDLAKQLADPASWEQLKKRLEGAGDAGKQLIGTLEPYVKEINLARESAEALTPGFVDLSGAVAVLADKSSSAEQKLSALKTIMDVLSGKQIPLAEAMNDYNKVINDVVASATEAADKTKGFGDALVGVNGAVNTVLPNGNELFDQIAKIRDESAKAGQAAFDQARQTGTLADAQQAARDAMSRSNEALGPLATKYGLTAQQISAMATAAGLVPEQIVTALSLQGADQTTQDLAAIELQLQKVGQGTAVQVKAPTDEARTQLEALGFKVEEVTGKPGVVKITAPNAEALGKLQEVIDKDIPPKTAVVTADTSEAFAKIDALRRERVAIQARVFAGLEPIDTPIPAIPGLPGNADGGRLPTTGPGTGVTDGFVGLIGGAPAVRLDGGEQITRRKMADKYPVELEMINAGTFPKLPGFADGGRIAVDRAANFLQSQSGKPYVYGGTGGQGFDCSGFISAGYAALRNLDTATRWFTTESDFGALGFESGLGPKGFLDIGVHNGGGGKMSHMAGTLNGVPFEAGANGVRYGSGATGADDGQFEHKYHLPGRLFVPADDGKESTNTGGKDKGKGTEADSTTSTPPEPKATDGTSKQSVQDVLGNLSEGLGNAAKSFVSGQLSSAFSALGISQSSNSLLGGIGAAVDYGVKLQQAKPTFSQAELAMQGPVTPGTPGWYEALLKTFRVPAIDTVLRDDGGPLKHGQAALNLSGQTEWVQTAEERAQYARDQALLRNVSRTGVGPGGTQTLAPSRPGVQIDNHITVSNERSQMRELKTQNQFAVMQFGGRRI